MWSGCTAPESAGIGICPMTGTGRYLLWQLVQRIRVAIPIAEERQATSSCADSHFLKESAVTSAGESGPPVFGSTSEARSPPSRHPA